MYAVILQAVLIGQISALITGQPTSNSTFKCRKGEFKCPSERCIPDLWICDGADDCGDKSDEQKCTPPTCRPDYEFACLTGKCIPKRWVCDGEKECPDGSDEKDCGIPKCAPNFVRCNGTEDCIPKKWVCDGSNDCGNNADEEGCKVEIMKCSESDTLCKNGEQCIHKIWKCDGDKDCSDGSDEEDCGDKKIAKHCGHGEFKCGNGDCIPVKFVCNSIKDCVDNSDEIICKNTSTTRITCQPGQWQCNDGDCIRTLWKCDGTNDCADRSDEIGCTSVSCSTREFRCRDRKQCIAKYKKCNGVPDCKDGSDETDCKKLKTECGKDDFMCKDGTCIHMENVCDARRDCAQGEDEPISCFIDECMFKNGHCSQICHNLKLGFECACKEGYKLENNNRTCTDLNECSIYGSCHQKCENIKGSFKCSCVDGYVLEPDGKTCKTAARDMWLYFANGYDIRKKNLLNNEYDTAVELLKGVVSFDFDIKNNRIYMTDVITETIQSASLADPTSLKTVIQNVHTPDGIAVDWITGKLYWTDTGYKTIEVAELDGRHNTDLVQVGLAQPRAIALDPENGYVYWSDWGSSASIEKISMDGDSETRVQLIKNNIVWPNGITLDIPQGKIYWIDAKLKRIEVADMSDGKNRMIVRQRGIDHPFALDNFEDSLYWTDWTLHGIKAISKFDENRVSTIQSQLRAPMDVKIFHSARQPTGSANPCAGNNNGCSHLCLLANKNGQRSVSCKCPRNMQLEGDKKCVGVPVTRGPKSSPTVATVLPSSDGTRQSTKTLFKSTKAPEKTVVVITNGPAVQKHVQNKSHGPSAGMIIGIIISALFAITLVIIVVICYIKRRAGSKSHVMYYKDMSTTPLEEDFDVEHAYNDDKAKIIAESFEAT